MKHDIFIEKYLNIINEVTINKSDTKFQEMINDYKILLNILDSIETNLSCGQINKYDYDEDRFLDGATRNLRTNYYGKLFSKIKDQEIQQQLLLYYKKVQNEFKLDKDGYISYKTDAEYSIHNIMKNLILPYLKKAIIKYKRDFSRWFKKDISDFI